ncbi:hypothetical protein FLX56_04240 [Synechococcus moorigangaii CMS01]|nr:hypothetical protein [Synechococcus moorigangaii CMS01]
MIIVYVVMGIVLILLLISIFGDKAKPKVSGASRQIADLEIQKAIAAGHKIEAIKLYRLKHNVGLKEAKEAIELLEKNL